MTTPGSLPCNFGRYRLLERIGGGGMAVVYRGTLSVAGGFVKDVAVKVVRAELAADEHFVTMFLDEARLAALLSHANLVQTFDFGEVEGTYFLAMEYVRGSTLAARLRVCRTRGETLGIARSVHVAAQVARGLGHAHRLADPASGQPLHLVHRDVSPQNVLISREGEVKLADFGIAKASMRSHVTQPGKIRGKCAYMAPEQARGQKLDARTDVFALGVVLWESLTGAKLFSGGSDQETLAQVIQKDVPPPSRLVEGVPAALDQVLMSMLARDPGRRPESGDAVARALADLTLQLARTQEDIDLSDSGSGTRLYQAIEPLPSPGPPPRPPSWEPGAPTVVRATPPPAASARAPDLPWQEEGKETEIARPAHAARGPAARRGARMALVAGAGLVALAGAYRAFAPEGQGGGAIAPVKVAVVRAEPATPRTTLARPPPPRADPAPAESRASPDRNGTGDGSARPAATSRRPAPPPGRSPARASLVLAARSQGTNAFLDGRQVTVGAEVHEIAAGPHRVELVSPEGRRCIVAVTLRPRARLNLLLERDGSVVELRGLKKIPLSCR